MKKTLLPVFACLALLFFVSPAFALTDEEFLNMVLNDEVEEVRSALAAGRNPDIVRIPGPIQLEIRRLPAEQNPLYRGKVYADGPLFRVSGDAVPPQTVSEEPNIQALPVPEREPKPAPTPGRDPRRKDIRFQSPLMATPLSIAVANGSMEMIRILLDGGADVNAPIEGDIPAGKLNLRGATPLDCARLSGDRELAETLERAGGKATDLIENLKRQLQQAPPGPR